MTNIRKYDIIFKGEKGFVKNMNNSSSKDNNIEHAKALLLENDYTCVAYNGDRTLVSTKRGVKPLLEWLDNEKELTGYSAADKVIGKGAAFLYIKLGVGCVYAHVISETSLSLLKKHNVDVTYGECVPAIRNRTNTGFCPIETSVLEIDEVDKAIEVIRDKMRELSNN